MHFHHLDPNKKHKDISRMRTIKAIKREAEKCIILCANCHVEREWGKNGSLRNYFKKKYSSG